MGQPATITAPAVGHEIAAPIATHRTRERALAVVAAVLAVLAVWTVAVPVLGVELRVRPGGTTQAVGLGAVIITTLIVSLLGWALLALLEHRVRRARAVWTVVAFVTLLLSLGAPLNGGVTASTKVTLALMHLAVGAVLISALRRTSPRPPPYPRNVGDGRSSRS